MNSTLSDNGSAQLRETAVFFTVALPIFNEAGILNHLHEQLTRACSRTGETYEILYINDGSQDRSAEILSRLAAEDHHVSIVELSRNFGHPAALAAGIEIAEGRNLILMDADLQDDPAAIPELLRIQREQNAEVVYVVRADRKEGWLMRLMFNVFHWLLERSSTYRVPRDAGSFGLLGPRALIEVRRMTERLRYFPGLRAFAGFKQVGVNIERKARYDDTSRVGFVGLVRLAGLAFFAQTRAPITIFYFLSVISLLLSFALIGYAFVAKILGIAVVSWASTVTSVAFFSSVIILGQAFICEYLARVYEEIRGRPIYIVDKLSRARIVTGAPHGIAKSE